MAWYLDTFFDRRDGGIEVVGGVHKRVIPSNWKFPAENFDGDAYHVAWSHLSGIKVGFSPGGSLRPGAGGKMVHPANGHCLIAFAPGNLADPDVPEITAYEEGIRLEVERRLGPRFGIIFPIVSTLFPNFFFLGSTARTFRVWRPALGADPPALKNRGLKVR